MTAAAHLAENIRTLRAGRNLSQAALAELAGIPRTTISSVESGDANPTLQVLMALKHALQVSVEELLSVPKSRVEHFPCDALKLERRGPGRRALVRKLLPHALPGVEIDRIELVRDAVLPGVPHRPGTTEYLYCERGQLVVRVDRQRFELAQGDVLAFPGDQRHAYSAKTAQAVGFSVVLIDTR